MASSSSTGETLQERSKGKDVRLSNIVAAKAVAQAVRTSLGPRGMDKLMVEGNGEVLISNDGATILQHLRVLHPAAKMLVDVSQSQDAEAGDGTTSVVVLAGALLEASGALLHRGIHPTLIATSFLRASLFVMQTLRNNNNNNVAVSRTIDLHDRPQLIHAVETCLSSKAVAQYSDVLAPLAVDSVLALLNEDDYSNNNDDTTTTTKKKTNVDLTNIRMVPHVGGTVEDTELLTDGLVLQQRGAAQQAGGPSHKDHAKIALLQYCLSAPKTDMDNSVLVSDYESMDRILREERKYILKECKKIQKSGCNVVLLQKSILRDAYNELSLHFLAKMGILVVTDIERTDVPFVCKTLGCTPIAHPDQLSAEKFGEAEWVGNVGSGGGGGEKVVKFAGVKHPGHTVTVLLRGSNDLVVAEASRSLHDAHCVVRSLVKERALIAGGGAAEMEAAVRLRRYALEECSGVVGSVGGGGVDAYCLQAYADALEVIPYTLAENAGMKPVDVVTELRAQHARGKVGAGINVKKGCVSEDMYEMNVVQPLLVTTSAIQLATETVCMILKVDDVVVVA